MDGRNTKFRTEAVSNQWHLSVGRRHIYQSAITGPVRIKKLKARPGIGIRGQDMRRTKIKSLLCVENFKGK